MAKCKFSRKGAFFMEKFENEKRCQTYEVTDFQHNFEIVHPTTTLQQWGLHIHSTHYELLVFIRGNAECWIEGRRKKLEYGDVVIVSPREIHRIFILDNTEYERIVIHVSDSMLKELSTAQTNLLGVFHKNRTHILHLSDEEMAQFISNQLQMKKMWKKKEFGQIFWELRGFRFCFCSSRRKCVRRKELDLGKVCQVLSVRRLSMLMYI